ncbi:MAG: aminoglycoside phosphotransferase family protein [Microbacteriaceae bacterium]|nr:MAG: aminoglycoside phosphotransferase family protein [Microbacteriaceae bacterium]
MLVGFRPEHVDGVTHVATGWDNAIFRAGDVAVRLPRREEAVQLLLHERRWLPELASRLPVAVPAPLASGDAAPGFPHPWAIVPWFDGTALWHMPPADRRPLAEPLARFLAALHIPAPGEAPVNPVRGVPLAERALAVPPPFDRPESVPLRPPWEDGLVAPVWDGPPVWVHGDLHPGNIVARDDGGTVELAAVIDWGDLGAGDPACDLVVAWFAFDAEGRTAFRAELERRGAVDDAMWRRGRARAAAITDSMLHTTAGDGDVARMSRRAVSELASGA